MTSQGIQGMQGTESSLVNIDVIKEGFSGSASHRAGNRGSKSILFIDDNFLVLETIKRLLLKTACALVTTDDPFDGLGKIARHKPHTVFIDANMQCLSGLQFCALVKASAAYKHTPVILVFEQADKLLTAKAIATGADSVLVKPFGKNELLNASLGNATAAA